MRHVSLLLELQEQIQQGFESDLVQRGGGPSRISSRFFGQALAISTNCCLPTPISFNQCGKTPARPTIFRYLSASA